MSLSEYLVNMAWKMKVGESFKIDLSTFQKAFPQNNYMALYDPRSPEDRFLEKLPGVNYGGYTLNQNILNGDYILSRHECGNDRIRIDCDRGGIGWKSFP